jgi:REP element-mobilizing transposase RayT
MAYNSEIHHRRSIRLKNYDYSQAGLYFVTICVQDRICLFGNIEDGEMRLNEYGKIIFDEWQNTPNVRQNIKLHEFVVMPNHIHGIIEITHKIGGDTPIENPDVQCRGVLHTPSLHTPSLHTPDMNLQNDNQGVCVENQGVCVENQGVCNTPLRSPSNTVGAVIRGFKSAVTKKLNELGFTHSIWQRDMWEHIIRDSDNYNHIADYILNNPKNWKTDKFYC